ncbi:MAG: isoprenylcysteine carboxylmethyltransferase family protein [Chitinophagaceae bacterium]|nr:isoprenylcysteine carboxylmethyltransferase family protein [Chitinophagaceae bacterium]
MKRIAAKDIAYVTVQLLLLLLYLFPIADRPFAISNMVRYITIGFALIGVIIFLLALLQLKSNLTPFPTPKVQGSLIQSGIYNYIRHPIYSGIIIFTLSYGVFSQSTWRIGVGLALWILFYFKSEYEEGLLNGRYKEYVAYREKTGRFFYYD